MPTWAKVAVGTTGIVVAGVSGVGAAAIAEAVIASAGISAVTDGAFYTVASLRNGSFSRSELKDTVINGAANGYMFGGAGVGVAGIRNAAKSGKLAGFMADEAGSVSYEGGRKTKLNYVTSNGLVLETTPNKTTTVLGTYKSDTGAILDELGNVKSLNFGPRDGGFNLLNTPDELYVSPSQFWNEYNKPWLDNAIARTDIFKIATEPTWDNLTRVNMFTGKTELTGFGREYTYLKKCGYYFDTVTKTMVKQGGKNVDNLWTNINDNIPMYMNKICNEYNLVCVKISPLKTAMIGDGFAIMIAIDRFDIEIYYLYKKNSDIGKYPCGSFFAQAYDSQDREGLLSGEGAEIYIKNCLMIVAKGLASKWENVLEGDKKWLEKYRSSSRYAKEKLTADEKGTFEKYFD